MTISPLVGSESTESAEVWGDFSGGQITFAFQHPVYTSLHILRVGAFDASGNYLGGPTSPEVTLQNTADNLAVLIRALYAADTAIAAVAVHQTLSDHTGIAPFDYTFATTHFGAGTGGGASLPVPDVNNLTSRGSDGSRWHLTLPGLSDAVSQPPATKSRWPAVGAGAGLDLLKYLCGITNGPIAALKTQVVTHNGVPISFTPGSSTSMVNKRLRRHFGIV